MNWLWLTLADPQPAENGQLLYSDGIIHALADAGIALDVVGLARPGGRHRNGEQTGKIRWWLAAHEIPPRWTVLASTLPRIAQRTQNAPMRAMVDGLLQIDRWDAVVFDSIALGWALAALDRRYARRKRPPILYIAHNDETNVAQTIADSERNPLRRHFKRLDASKVAALERALCEAADVISSNAPEDRAKFLARCPDKPVEFLPPGYGGPRVAQRTIGSTVPRRASIVGTFDWHPKRVSLESFLLAADRALAASGVGLYVVGQADEDFLARMRARFPETRFTGRVDDVAPYMRDSRLALVPDTLGGFKLKALDYVFNRLPILALDGSVPGMPLVPGESILFYPDHAALTRGVLDLIDDFPRLNALQERAFAASSDAFDWPKLAGGLIVAVERCRRPGRERRATAA